MAVLETLKVARKRIAKEEHWTKGAFARNKEGSRVFPKSRSACCWCILGAIRKEIKYNETEMPAIEVLQEHLPSPYLYVGIFHDHDKTTHKDIIDLLDRAIKAEEERNDST